MAISRAARDQTLAGGAGKDPVGYTLPLSLHLQLGEYPRERSRAGSNSTDRSRTKAVLKADPANKNRFELNWLGGVESFDPVIV